MTALKIQRFSLVVVTLLAVFMVAPGGDIFDQVADVERSWISGPSTFQALLAAACFGLLALALWYLGGLRAVRSGLAFTGTSIRMGTTARKEPYDNDRRWVGRWLAIPAALLVLALVFALLSWAHVSWLALIGACTVPVAVVVSNALVLRAKWNPPVHQRLIDPGVTPYVWLIGDFLAVAVCWILGLSVVRSFTALAILDVDRKAAVIAMVLGAIVAVVVWPIAWIPFGKRFRRARKSLEVSTSAGGAGSTGQSAQAGSAEDSQGAKPVRVAGGPSRSFDVKRLWLRLTAYLVFPVAAVILILFPGIVGGLGPVATVAACLTVIALGLIAVAVAVQWREPLRLFRGLGLDTTPALTLIAVAGLLVVTVDRSPDTHLTRAPNIAQDRPTPLSAWKETTFAESVQHWLDDGQTQSCAIDAGHAADGRPIRMMPMMLIGAAGGGIRAAWWTVKTLDTLADDPCGRHAVLAVSSVSGSSLGMALMLTSDDPIGDAAKLGDAAPLSQAVDGLLSRDLFTGLTGINVATPGNDDTDYPDRAALLEQAWEQAVPSLSTPFPNPPANSGVTSDTIEPAWHVPWRSFLNTTSARTGCRVVISDVTTEPENGPRANPDCDVNGDSSIPGSYNLFAVQPCLAGMRASTAALLSSRFPYILPSGLVEAPDCVATGGTDVSDQLIDGGYAENSGLGTLGDLAGQYMPLVRDHNRQQLARNDEEITVVVPIVISLENSPQVPVTGASPHPPVAETLAPVMSGLRRGATLQNTAALLERTVNETADWLPCTPIGQCTGLAGEIDTAATARFSTRGIEVAPASAPRIAAPLGWAMSAASRAAMDTAFKDVLDSCGSNCEFSNLVSELKAASNSSN